MGLNFHSISINSTLQPLQPERFKIFLSVEAFSIVNLQFYAWKPTKYTFVMQWYGFDSRNNLVVSSSRYFLLCNFGLNALPRMWCQLYKTATTDIHRRLYTSNTHYNLKLVTRAYRNTFLSSWDYFRKRYNYSAKIATGICIPWWDYRKSPTLYLNMYSIVCQIEFTSTSIGMWKMR